MQYNLKDQDEYIEFFEEVIEDIDDINTFNEQGFPLDEDTNELVISYKSITVYDTFSDTPIHLSTY